MPVYCEQPPITPLSRWVECGWFELALRRIYRAPCSAGWVSRHRLRSIRDGLRAIGAMTRERRFHFPKGAYVAGIRFQPGMAGTFLGLSPGELTDISAPLAELWPRRAHELKRRLDDAHSIQDAMRILLGALAATPNTALTPMQQAIEALTVANGNADLDFLRRVAPI